MLVSETTFAAAFAAPAGEARVFDDIGCLVAAVKKEANPAALRFWFHDAPSGDWIEGTAATFVRSERFRTPMSGGLLAYRDPAAAIRSAAESHGIAIGTLTELLSQRLRPEQGDGVNRGAAAAPSEKLAGVGPREQ
jgi:hypothetical protein